MNKKIIALIPARAGSKGIKNKNIRLLGGYPLIAYSILASKLSKYIQRTIVSTDSMLISAIAMQYDAEVPFLRPEQHAQDTTPDYSWIAHALAWLENENYTPDLIVHLRPTTPLREISKIDLAISNFLQTPEATSLRSAHPLEESPYKMFIKDGDYLKSFMQYGEGEFYNLPRQEFPTVFNPNGYIDILRTSEINPNSIHGKKILAYETKRCIEVDSLDNLEELEKYYKENSIYQVLKSKYNL
jgi:CMP-N-acetylneuraminic acid synthetase